MIRDSAIEIHLERNSAGQWHAVAPSEQVLALFGVDDPAQLERPELHELARYIPGNSADRMRALDELLDDARWVDEFRPPVLLPSSNGGGSQWLIQHWRRIDATHMRVLLWKTAAPLFDQLMLAQPPPAVTHCAYCGRTLPLVGGRGHRRGQRAVCDRIDCLRAAERDRKREWRQRSARGGARTA